MREALEEHGVEGELLLIEDGAEAIRYVEGLAMRPEACPDLVIIDLNLPKRSGREVLQSIRQNTIGGGMTVVVLSSSDRNQDRSDALTLGASRYIPKPLRLEDFLGLGAVFREMLEGGGAPKP